MNFVQVTQPAYHFASAPTYWLWILVFVHTSNQCNDDKALDTGGLVAGTVQSCDLWQQIQEQPMKHTPNNQNTTLICIELETYVYL